MPAPPDEAWPSVTVGRGGPPDRRAERRAPEARPFRVRLLGRLGLALAVALAALGLVAWALAALGARSTAVAVLTAEAVDIAEHLGQPGGTLDLRAPGWSEPHHRFLTRHIDPYFVQVFDARGRLVHVSENVAALGARYPQRLLSHTASLVSLHSFTVPGLPPPEDEDDDADDRPVPLYAIQHALVGPGGDVVATLQIGRYEPASVQRLPYVGLGIAAGVLGVLAGLLGLVWTVGGSVVRPLEALTAHAHRFDLAAEGDASARVPVPDDADRETRALARALDEALGRLSRAFDEQRRFTADAAHELQTPLTALVGHVDVTLRRDRTAEAYREALVETQARARGLIATVRALLTLARLDRPEASDLDEPLDLAEIAHAEAEAVRPAAAARGLALVVEAEAAPWTGPRALVADAVRILLDNALKYTDAGTVAVRCGADARGVWIEVADTGIGMAEADLAQAGRRFFRARAVQERAGTGIGLALAARIAERLGGTLTLASREGNGTRGRLALPASPRP